MPCWEPTPLLSLGLFEYRRQAKDKHWVRSEYVPLKSYQYHVEVFLRHMMHWLFEEHGIRVVAIVEAPTVKHFREEIPELSDS